LSQKEHATGEGEGPCSLSFKDVIGLNPVACVTIILMFSFRTRGYYVVIRWYLETPY